MGKEKGKNQEGEKKASEESEEKVKVTVEEIGKVVASSGFKQDGKNLAASIKLLEALQDFMTIETGSTETPADKVASLLRAGILTEEQAKEATEKAKEAKKVAGGVEYNEENRKAINFSRTCVSHVVRLLIAIKS